MEQNKQWLPVQVGLLGVGGRAQNPGTLPAGAPENPNALAPRGRQGCETGPRGLHFVSSKKKKKWLGTSQGGQRGAPPTPTSWSPGQKPGNSGEGVNNLNKEEREVPASASPRLPRSEETRPTAVPGGRVPRRWGPGLLSARLLWVLFFFFFLFSFFFRKKQATSQGQKKAASATDKDEKVHEVCRKKDVHPLITVK